VSFLSFCLCHLYVVLGLTTEGIYRLCGQQSVITRLLNSLSTGKLISHLRSRWRNDMQPAVVVFYCLTCFNFYLLSLEN